jgi:SAM-dependent methyltransferase
MRKAISERVWSILTCPGCGNPLSRTDKGAECSACRQPYAYTDEGQLDLRLRAEKSCQLEFRLGVKLEPPSGVVSKTLGKNPSPQVDFSGLKVPWHLRKELLSHFPRAEPPGSLMLDLGCGSAIHRTVCEHAGFEYVGLDYDSPLALLLGDGHALPFQDNSFAFILSIAVLEHVQYPFVMMKETYRVLKPGGKFIGTVAFLEPFHGDSFYHHTYLGAYNSLAFAGFEIQAIAPVPGWSVLTAQAIMSLFPKLPRPISKAVVFPLHLLHRLWWKIGYLVTHSKTSSEESRVLQTAGAFSFLARKPNRARASWSFPEQAEI